MTLEAGMMLAHYRLVEKIGEGGMGVVYKALDTRLERHVALKLLRPEMARDPERLARFEREAKAVAALNHPNIAAIHQIDSAGDCTFIVMELIEGVTLRQRLARRPLPPDTLVELATQIADALDAAHARGVVHRDLKPPNLIVTDRGPIKILDFGLAKLAPAEGEGASAGRSGMETALLGDLTSPGATMGTIAYMSPEQVRGDELDQRTDLFSFGAVLYEMATGKPAFGAATSGLTFDAILNRAPTPLSQINPEMPRRIEELIGKALEKDRNLRYQSAAEMRTDLSRLRRDLDSGRVSTDSGRRTATATEPAAEAAAPRGRRIPLKVFFIAFGLFMAGLVLWRGTSQTGRGTPIDSVAVMPFENATGDEANEYLADGITESLINSLSRVPDLRVVPRSLVFPMKGQRLDMKEAGRKLKVAALVTGRVSQRGDTLMVVAELTDARRVAQIWGRQYSRKITDILLVQEEIAKEIAGNIQGELSPDEEERIADQSTEDPEAFRQYITSLAKSERITRKGLEEAAKLAEQAVALDLRRRGKVVMAPHLPGGAPTAPDVPPPADPGYAPALAVLARTLTRQVFHDFIPADENREKAKSAAEWALGNDDLLATGHASQGFVRYFWEWDWKGAGESFARASALAPMDAGIMSDRAWYLMAMGRTTEALAAMKMAREAETGSAEFLCMLAEMSFWAGNVEEAEDLAQEAVARFPDEPLGYMVTAFAQSARGEHADAVDTYLEYLSRTETECHRSPTLAWFYAAAGKQEEARKAFDRSRRTGLTPVQAAWIQAALGEKDAAFAALERAYDQKSSDLVWIKSQPWYKPLRGDPRLADLTARMKLPG